MNWLDKLERKIGRFHINNLIVYIILIQVFVYFLATLGGVNVVGNLTLRPDLVAQGQVWRLITFIFVPPLGASIIGLFFSLYFDYLAGQGLEHEWGSFKFNVYYLVGALATIIVSFITGASATGTYINLSLFLAFAQVYPDFEVLLLFILPIKVKYLAWINWLIIIYQFITAPTVGTRILVLVPVVNFLIFFGKNIITGRAKQQKAKARKAKFQANIENQGPRHKCTVCGITEKDDPNMEFRYCSKCNGHYGYCMNHIRNHQHIK